MKKYIMSATAFLLMAGMINAQTTKKISTDNPSAKMSKSTAANKKTISSTTAVSPATTGTEKKTGAAATIKRKHHPKKTKSVPVSNK
jgi:hypothetical protein